MRIASLSLALSALLLPAIAKADTFSFSTTAPGGGFSGSGQITATNNGDGSFTADAISGNNIVSLIPADPFSLNLGNDNVLYPNASRLVNVDGIAFNALFGGQTYSVNLFSTVSGFEEQIFDSLGNFVGDDSAALTLANTSTVTPEPSSIVLFGSGLLALAALSFRKRLAM